MDQNRLGRSTLTVSRVGLGCNNFGRRIDREASLEVLAAAVEAGITFFDTADIYGTGASERIVGEALAGRSDEFVVATKFGNDMEGANGDAPGGSREYVRRAIDASLERLGRDHVDLYYYHRPDGVTPLEETLGAMHELVRRGQGALARALERGAHASRAGSRLRGGRQQPGRRGAELLQPAPSRRRGGGAAARARARDGLHPVLPARERPPDRQVPARRARARGGAAQWAERRPAQ